MALIDRKICTYNLQVVRAMSVVCLIVFTLGLWSPPVVLANDKIILQLRWDHQFQFAGYYAAMWQGLYAEAGLDVEIRSAITEDGILSATEEVASERAHFGIGGVDILKAYDAGDPLVVVASIFQHSAAAFYTRQEITITSPADFLEYKVARRVNDLIDVELQAMLMAEGVDPAQVEPYPHQPGVDHLLSGKVDVIPGYSINIPYTARTIGVAINEFRPIKYGVDFYGDSIFTHARLVHDDPDLVARFKTASIQGWEYALTHPEEVIQRITKELSGARSIEHIEKFNTHQSEGMVRLINYPVVEIGHTNPARWERMHQYLGTLGITRNALDLHAFIFDPETIKIQAQQKLQERLGLVLLILLMAAVVAVTWIITLRRTVQGKTRELLGANKALAESREYLRTIYNGTPAMLHSIDSEGNLLSVSDFWLETLGYERQEVLGRPSVDFLTEESRAFTLGIAMPHFYREGKISNVSCTFIKKNGETIEVLLNALMVKSENSEMTQSLAVMIDVTEQRRIEKQLQESEEKFRTFFEQAGGYCMILDPNTADGIPRIIEANEAACAAHGYAHEEFIGRPVTDIDDEDGRRQVKQRTAEIMKGAPVYVENTHVRKDGSTFPVAVHAKRIDIEGKKPLILTTEYDISERKRTENELHDSKERYEGLFNSIRDAILVTDIDRVIVDCNPAFTNLFGYGKNEITGKHTLSLYESEGEFQELGNALRENCGDSYFLKTVNFKKKNGDIFPGDTGVYFLKNSRGETVGYIGLIRDVSFQKRAEKALKQSNAELRLAQKMTSIGNWSFDPGDDAPEWSAEIYTIYERDQSLGPMALKDYQQLYHGVWSDTFNDAIQNAITYGTPYDIELQFKLPSNRAKWVRAICEPDPEPGPNGHFLRGTIQDITKIKQIEEQLRKSREQFELAMDASQDGLFDWDLRTNTIYYSPGWKRMLGYEDHELPNDFSVWENLTEPEDVRRSWEMQQELINRERERFELEFKMKHKDGHWIDILSRAKALFDDNGKAIRIVGTHVDTTERKRLEKRLLQAQKMESIGTLAGGIAHDFNNILTSIIGFTELALEEVSKGSLQEDYLDEVRKAGIRAKELVQQILAFARQSEEKKQPYRLRDIITEALKLLRPSTPANIEIITTLNSTAKVVGNSSQLHQIVMNLCTNAIHSLQDSGGILEIDLQDIILPDDSTPDTSILPAGKYVELVVTDNGPGIHQAIVDKIFEPYFTTKGVGDGTGMGLAMVKGIVENSGGAIHVESGKGEKTTFVIRLPAAVATESGGEDQAAPPLLGNERILFIDDEPPVARIGSRMLESLGYAVTTQTSSVEALAVFKNAPDTFDLVITDMTMPSMTGDMLSLEIRKIRQDIPIILCTGYSSTINDEGARLIGIDALTYKPFTRSDLARTVREALDGR